MTETIKGRVFVKDIRLHAFHGVLPQERVTGNDYLVSVSADCPMAAAVDTDDVDLTLNYAAVYAIVKEEMAVSSQLVEHVAGRIGRRVLREFAVADNVVVTVTKLNPPMGAACAGAGVELTICR